VYSVHIASFFKCHQQLSLDFNLPAYLIFFYKNKSQTIKFHCSIQNKSIDNANVSFIMPALLFRRSTEVLAVLNKRGANVRLKWVIHAAVCVEAFILGVIGIFSIELIPVILIPLAM
jgi:hypothetical protein